MSGAGPIAALKAAQGADRQEFVRDAGPKCPHCGHECDIDDNGWYRLYQDGDHDVTCPDCGEEFTVASSSSWTFSTLRSVEGQ